MDDKKLREVMKAVEEARNAVDDYYSEYDSMFYGMPRYVPETYRLYFPATIGKSEETLAEWKEMMKAGTSEMPMLTLDEVEDVPLPEGYEYTVYIGEKEVHGFSIRSEAIRFIIDRWLALTDEQRAEIFHWMDVRREEDERETHTPSPFNRLYMVSWLAYNGDSPWRFQLRDPYNGIMLDMTRFPQMLVHTEGDIGIPGGQERYKEYMDAWENVFDSIDEAMKSKDEQEDEDEEAIARREEARKRMEEFDRKRTERRERKRKEFMDGCMKNLGYCPEPEPYREELVTSMKWNAKDGYKRIRVDLEPQDSSVGLKLVRVGSYKAGANRWDGRFRNGHRYYDIEGDYFLEFDDGSRLECFHEPDCCEDNYADFPGMQVIGVQEGNSVNARDLTFFPDVLNSIIPIKDLGFYIVTVEGICILVPCYSKQNGEYSTEIALVHRKRYVDLGEECVKFVSDYDEEEDD